MTTLGTAAPPDLGAYLQRLAQVADFSFEELQLNRTGQLHPAQQRKLGTIGGIIAVVVFVLMGAATLAIAGCAFFYLVTTDMPAAHQTIHWIVGGVFGALGLFFWFGAAIFGKNVRTVRSGRVEQLTGPVDAWSQHSSSGMRYRLIVKGRKLRITEEVHAAIVPALHHVYACGDRLLSLEPVGLQRV